MGLAEVVDHNVKYGEEGVHVDHGSPVPFPSGTGSKPTLNRGHLPLNLRPANSHQAFKGEVSLRRPLNCTSLTISINNNWQPSFLPGSFGKIECCSCLPHSALQID